MREDALITPCHYEIQPESTSRAAHRDPRSCKLTNILWSFVANPLSSLNALLSRHTMELSGIEIEILLNRRTAKFWTPILKGAKDSEMAQDPHRFWHIQRPGRNTHAHGCKLPGSLRLDNTTSLEGKREFQGWV